MAIHLSCHHCNASINAPDAMAGKNARCPRCKATFGIPRPDAIVVSKTPPPLPPPAARPQEEARPASPIFFHPPRTNATAIASMVLGCLCFVVSLMPCLSFVAFPLSTLAFALGLIGLFVATGRGGTGAGYAIVGMGTSGMALLIALTIYHALEGFRATPVPNYPPPSKQVNK